MDESAPSLPNPTITTDPPAPSLPPPPPAPAAVAPAPAMAAPPAPATAAPTPAPAPTMAAPAAPAPAAPAAPSLAAPMAPPPAPGDANVQLAPVAESPSSSSKRPLMILLTLITVLAAGIGAYIVTQGDSSDSLTDTTPNLVPDGETQSDAAFSFAAAATNASTAGSMRLEMTADTPDGATTMVATVDRASQRISIEADLSQLNTDESFVETPDSVSMILDESTSTMYLDSGFFGFFGDVATPWISTSVDDMDDSSGSVDEIFANPFEMDFLFGDVEPVDLGLETIEGEELRHFQIPVSVTDALAADENEFIDLNEIEGIDALDDIVYDVWVSEDNTIRRIGLDVVLGDQAAGFDMWIEVSPDAVEIAVPDPSEVTDLEELFGSWTTELENPDSGSGEGTVDFETTIEIDDGGSLTLNED